MINFRVTDIQGGLLTIERPAGQAISLRLSEIVRAQVMEILPSGAVALRVKGEPLIAKTQVPLQPGANAYFKVTGLPVEGKDLVLQFIGFSPEERPEAQQQPSAPVDRQQLSALIKEFQSLLEQMKGAKNEQPLKTARLQGLNLEILKSLPEDIQSLPKETRTQIQELLQNSLRLTGNSIQSKITELIKNIPANTPQSGLIENIKRDLSVSIDRLLNTSLKGAIQDTGVALEAKLKNLAQGALLTPPESLQERTITAEPSKGDSLSPKRPSALEGTVKIDASLLKSTSADNAKANIASGDNPLLHNDLKAKLLQLKQTLEGAQRISEDASNNTATSKIELGTFSSKSPQSDAILQKIDSLLKDIETFQTLSKATNSFYTFLPLDWKGLKEGDISFKKGKGRPGGISPYSCRVNLDLQGLGAVGLIVMKYGKDFYISLRVEDEEFQGEIKRDLGALAESFNARGMSLRSVRVFDYKDTEGFHEIEELAVAEEGINIRA